MNVKKKIMLTNTGGILLTVFILITVLLWQKIRLKNDVRSELDVLARSECSKVARDAYLMLKTHPEGLQQKDTDVIRKAIMDMKVGKTGYVYVIGGSGDQKGKYIVSKGGTRDGEVMWDMTDAAGSYVIRSVVQKALATKDGQCDFERYPWKNKDETEARWKIAAVTYFEPLDWVIGAGAYEDDFQDSLAHVDASVSRLTIYSSLGALAAIVVCGIVTMLVANHIVRPLAKTVDMLRDIAQGEGDLTKRLDVSGRDEIGQLAQWFNTFMDKLQQIITQIAGTARTAANEAMGLASTSTQMASQAEHLNGSTTTAAASTEQMNSNMKNIASSSEEMSTNIRTVASAVEQMTSCIREIAKNADQAASVAQKAARLAEDSDGKIAQLGQAADQIGKVVEVIQDIAEQTNLLALNATIEAARAGDAGKGFAVVANEVKELAKQTTEATEDIRNRVQAIQGSTGGAVKSIGEIRVAIQSVSDVSQSIASAVEQQSVTTNEIANNIAQTASASEFVSQNVHQIAAASSDISRNISGVGQAVHQTTEGVVRIQTASKDLSQLSEELRALVGRFKLQ